MSATPAQFEAAFNRARPPAPLGKEAIAFSALVGGSNVATRDKFARAIAHVRADGWLQSLIEQIVTSGEISGIADLLNEAHEQSVIAEGSTLQQLLDASRAWDGAGIQFQGLANAIRQVCRINIDGVAKGTGFLVRPDIVLTAYHVIRPLTEHDPNDLLQNPAIPVKQLPGSGDRLQIIFDDVDMLAGGIRKRMAGIAVGVAENWLVDASPCHREELRWSLPNDFHELANLFDFALIRLRGVRIGIQPVQIRDRPVHVGAKIALFQHPAGLAMAVDKAEVVALCGDWRFKHNVNTDGGSSGSPCFDREFNVVGLHQAGGRTANRAVPLAAVRPIIQALPPSDPRVTPICELTEEEPGHPVIGRVETQEWVWEQLEAEKRGTSTRPILVLRGHQGTGKSFTTSILRSLLPRSEHYVVRMGAREDVQALLPSSFANRLLERLGSPPMPDDAQDPNTEQNRSWKLTHLPLLIAALEEARAGRGIWIAIDDIEKASIGSSSEISDYLFAFYAEAARRSWLRFVLLGLPSVPEVLRDNVRRYDLTFPTKEDISNYLFTKLPTSISYDERKGIVSATQALFDGEDQIVRLQANLARVVRFYAKNGYE